MFGVREVPGDALVKRRVLGHLMREVPLFVDFPNGVFHEEIISNGSAPYLVFEPFTAKERAPASIISHRLRDPYHAMISSCSLI